MFGRVLKSHDNSVGSSALGCTQLSAGWVCVCTDVADEGRCSVTLWLEGSRQGES